MFLFCGTFQIRFNLQAEDGWRLFLSCLFVCQQKMKNYSQLQQNVTCDRATGIPVKLSLCYCPSITAQQVFWCNNKSIQHLNAQMLFTLSHLQAAWYSFCLDLQPTEPPHCSSSGLSVFCSLNREERESSAVFTVLSCCSGIKTSGCCSVELGHNNKNTIKHYTAYVTTSCCMCIILYFSWTVYLYFNCVLFCSDAHV